MLAKTRKLLKDNSGVAMIYSLVIGIVVAIFAVMLLMVTYSLYASSSRQTGQTQCRIMAESYAECLKDELKDPESTVRKYISEQLKEGKSDIELDLIQDNYTIYTKFELAAGGINGNSTEEDNDTTVEADDNDPNALEAGEGATPTTPTPSESSPAKAISGSTKSLKAVIKCNKGGTGGIGEQSYTITQYYKVKID